MPQRKSVHDKMIFNNHCLTVSLSQHPVDDKQAHPQHFVECELKSRKNQVWSMDYVAKKGLCKV